MPQVLFNQDTAQSRAPSKIPHVRVWFREVAQIQKRSAAEAGWADLIGAGADGVAWSFVEVQEQMPLSRNAQVGGEGWHLSAGPRVRRESRRNGARRAVDPSLIARNGVSRGNVVPVLHTRSVLREAIHAAGNPDAIARLEVDCLQSIPLLEGRELLVWRKGRAGKLQRRSFRTTDPFEPPALVREIVQWTQRLRPHVPVADRNRLFLIKGHWGVAPFSMKLAHNLRNRFVTHHHLPYFALSAIRPGVLTAFLSSIR